MEMRMIAIKNFIFCSLIIQISGCLHQDENNNNQQSNIDIEGTWSGTINSSFNYYDESFSSETNSSSDVYFIIRKNSDGTYEFPDKLGNSYQVNITNNSFTANDIVYEIQNDSTITSHRTTSSYDRESSLAINLRKISTDAQPVGSVTKYWSGTNTDSSLQDINYAEYRSSNLTSTDGADITEIQVFINHGITYDYFSKRSGTDSHLYIDLQDTDKRLFGFDRNITNLEIDYFDITKTGFSVNFNVTIDGDSVVGSTVVSTD